MSDGFMNGQPQMGWIENQVVFSRFDRLCRELLARLLSGKGGFGDKIVAFDIIPARSAGSSQARAAGKFS
jgi:hypothetical protein